MKKVLVVNSNPKPNEISFGLRLGEHYLASLQAAADVQIERVNLYEENIPLIDGSVLDGWGKAAAGETLSEQQLQTMGRMNEILEQFIAADVVIFITPMWNLSYPPLLKAYIDNVIIAGRTFKYTAEGPQGLLNGKKVVHIEARGGFYSEGPAQAMRFTDSYLSAVMAFIGITEYENVVVEGMNAVPDRAEALLEEAKQRAEASVKRMFAQV
ncbi:FMN-dependent NADH-azoreductase [Paenibacillus apiarius]|uniref:FMN dependent NADH:quinone oxidoreductase n=1 Tax=Paenibacillus apiarius TaxID=46240 RepID=A0ABT4E301_9BACL|nr:NAD(P)H-dependent oxidoreductase [Paenibacillus apiarius]MCY9514964.1 NAD(P)H-dependent oxidoreductase [Paenibacillus apiarius]MCY9523380.1 NAD(P)H-dependent oxidoreductase [Paenibacillus apiarius]MCY9554208.1 NAD(P)H-dependent oxidoreductase [Paenibacillus apiarius]MCY9559382.1 NAD(P)H-dependent oxidoreductase [Paenibacillus apiarius]MCY9686807.1 NAD(P)H-dependent oxidoreductase [Paenibacillus apiarius]